MGSHEIKRKYWYPYLRIRYRNGQKASIYLGNKGGESVTAIICIEVRRKLCLHGSEIPQTTTAHILPLWLKMMIL